MEPTSESGCSPGPALVHACRGGELLGASGCWALKPEELRVPRMGVYLSSLSLCFLVIHPQLNLPLVTDQPAAAFRFHSPLAHHSCVLSTSHTFLGVTNTP